MSELILPNQNKDLVDAEGDRLDLFLDPDRLQAVEQSQYPCNSCSNTFVANEADSGKLVSEVVKAKLSFILSPERVDALVEEGIVMVMSKEDKLVYNATDKSVVKVKDVIQVKVPAKWAFFPSAPVEGQPKGAAAFVCGHCFLYRSAWGTRRRHLLDRMVDRTEKSITTNMRKTVPETPDYTFPRDAKQQLVYNIDTDKILSAILVASQYQYSKYEQMMDDAKFRSSIFGNKPQFSLKE